MNLEKSHLTSYPKCKSWHLQIAGALMLYILPLPTYANDDDTLLQFSMQVGSIIYVIIIVSLFVRNIQVRLMLLAVYVCLTVSAYLLTLNPVFEINIFITVIICSIIPLLSTIVLAILVRLLRKT